MEEQAEFLRIVRIEADGSLPAGSFAALRANEVDGLLVHRVFDQDACTRVRTRSRVIART